MELSKNKIDFDNECREVFEHRGNGARLCIFDESLFTQDLCNKLVDASPCCAIRIPEKYQTKEMVVKAVKDIGTFRVKIFNDFFETELMKNDDVRNAIFEYYNSPEIVGEHNSWASKASRGVIAIVYDGNRYVLLRGSKFGYIERKMIAAN